MNKIQPLVLFMLAWRLLLFIPLAVGFAFIPYRIGYEYTNIWRFIPTYLPVSSPFLFPWANFDGVHYLRIAGEGYTNNGGFFPLYPIITHFVSSLFGTIETFGGVEFFSAIILSNIFFFLAILLFYKLLKFDYKEAISQKSIIFLLLFPTSFFFVSIYTESLFLLLSLLVFFHARRREWLQAGLFGGLLSATRIVGIAILPALLLEFILQKKDTPYKAWPLVLVPLGLLSYMWFNIQKWGDAFYFLSAHGMIATNRSVDEIVLFPQTIFRYGKIFSTGAFSQFEYWIAALEVGIFFFVSAMLYVAWKKGVRMSYVVFGFLCFLIPASSGTFTGLPRYAVVLFPIFIALALIKNKKIQWVYGIISCILLFILLMLFSRGYFVA